MTQFLSHFASGVLIAFGAAGVVESQLFPSRQIQMLLLGASLFGLGIAGLFS